MEISQKTQDIAKGNDIFRRDFNQEKIILTPGVESSPYRNAIIESVKNFDDFNENNDPYGERTFAAFYVHGEKYFFKIDFFTSEFEAGADPYEDSTFKRVLTVMRSDEY